MAQDLFEDSTMTFGEHLEELRQHLWRAVMGVIVALVVTMYYGAYVVKIITYPMETRLEEWFKVQFDKRARTLMEQLPQLQVTDPVHYSDVTLEVTLSEAERLQLARALVPGAVPPPLEQPLTLKLSAKVGPIVQALSVPMANVYGRWKSKTMSAQEGFMIFFKASMGAALVLASPWVFYQIYSFIAVGLYAHERRLVQMSLPFAVGLFLAGVLFCYFAMFPVMLRFFLSVNDWMDIEPDIRLNEWVGFAVMLVLIFGVMFQLPLLMLILERVGIVSYEQMAQKWKVAVFVNFIVAALVTPTGDPYSQALLAIPMCFLFGLGLLLMKYSQRANPFTREEALGLEPEF